MPPAKKIGFITGKGRSRTLQQLLPPTELLGKITVIAAPVGATSLTLTSYAAAVELPERREQAEDALRILIPQVDLLCLCGYMRLLTASFLEACELWRVPVLNVHPALLPAFPGKDPQQQALNYGVQWTGTTVHLVTPGVDDGPIVLQEPVPVLQSDDLESLSERLRTASARIYTHAIRIILSGSWKVEGRKVVLL